MLWASEMCCNGHEEHDERKQGGYGMHNEQLRYGDSGRSGELKVGLLETI